MSESEGEELSQDVVFDILSNSRRRFILSHLQQQDEPVGLMELANRIAAWENDTTVDQLTDKQSKRVYVSVYQTHVPKLESTGLIDYDPDTGLIRLSEQAKEIDRYMPNDDTTETPWHRYYIGLAIAAAGFYALVALNVPVFGAISTTIAGLVIVGAFAGLSVAHYIQSSRNHQNLDEIPVENEG
ncbi:DUF7344 domain-containing protein [Haloarchaeobius sp. HRN-SO-5]|uniref:DUF7344 domain-containing protein n=1 Tax=Haloarchaeobius sp. HRN-SO-5 TaxID=3446118 RepID=UPI003EB7FEF4